MNPDGTVRAAEPDLEDIPWEFGDHPYGLEFLILPPTDHAAATLPKPPPVLPGYNPHVMLSQVRALSEGGPGLQPAAAPSAEELFWFRWITGHQITFLTWRLMGILLDRRSLHRLDDGVVASLRTYIEGYSAMLLYTGSCPPEIYHSLIRSRMYHQHRGFSGSWAPDFAPVRTFFRGSAVADLAETSAADLAQVLQLNREVHDDVATRLVPDGRSLLQRAAKESRVGLSLRTALVYDNFFMTLRSRVGVDELIGQLLHRLCAASMDVARHGLYPYGKDNPRGPGEVCSPAVVECEDRLGQVLADVAHAATLGTPVRCLSASE
jgi:L-tyrosine peroxygenase